MVLDSTVSSVAPKCTTPTNGTDMDFNHDFAEWDLPGVVYRAARHRVCRPPTRYLQTSNHFLTVVSFHLADKQPIMTRIYKMEAHINWIDVPKQKDFITAAVVSG